MNRRLALIKHYLSGRAHGTPVVEFLRIALGPTCGIRGRRYIDETSVDGEFMRIRLRGVDKPLYLPTEVPIPNLYQVVTEQFFPLDWHRYEVYGTMVEKDDVVVDCGAAEGLFAHVVAPRCKKVYAIEPQSGYIASMKKSMDGYGNVECIHAAIGDADATAYLSGSGCGAIISGDPSGEPIKVLKLDTMFKDRSPQPTYLKADLEGFEMKFLAGARETIFRNSPKVAITTYHKKDDAVEIAAFLKSVHPDYTIKVKGIEMKWGSPVMLHAWRAKKS